MGPFASQILADLGADVVKLAPNDGDTWSSFVPRLSSPRC